MFGCLFEKRSSSNRSSFFTLSASPLQLYPCPPLPAGKFFCLFSGLLSPNALSQWERVRGLFEQAESRASIEKIFFKFFVKTGCVSASQFQISEGIKNFLRFRVCIWLLPVGISEGGFGSKQNKAPTTEKYFLIFFCEIGCHLAL